MPPLPKIDTAPRSPVRSHVEMLHHIAAGLNGVLVASTFYASPIGQQDVKGAITKHTVGDIDGMVGAIDAAASVDNANVYVGLQVMRAGIGRGQRGTEADIMAVLGLVADMDADTGKAGAVPFPPSYVIETSPGNKQPAWLFDRPLAPLEAKALAGALRRATESDAGTSDITHVWRVPGTRNWPNAKKLSRGRDAEPFDVQYIEEWDGDLVDVDAFRAALEPWMREPANDNQFTMGEAVDIASITVSANIAAMLTSDGQPDRSAHAARLVEAISFDGHTAEEGLALFMAADGEWTERYKSTDAQQKDFERLWGRFGVREEQDLTPWLPTKLLAKSRLTAPAQAADVAAPTEEHPPVIYATPFQWIDPKMLPRRDFVYGTHLIRKYVSVTVSPGGLGKTSLTIAEALAMVTGRPLLGTKPSKALRCWLFNAEDPRDEMDRRIMAAAMHFRLTPKDVEGLFLDTGREQDLIVAYEDKRTGVTINGPVVEAVVDQIRRNRIDVMVVDPFVSTHGVSENDNGAIDKVTKLWAKIADETNCAIELVHHVRKSEGRDVTVEDARGAVSLLAAARSARVLNRMTEDQASAAGVPPQDRFSYFSVTRGKANLAPMSGQSEWRRLVSVALGNGDTVVGPAGRNRLGRGQDHAGVVTEWQWPDKEAIVEDVTAEQIKRICAEIDMSDCRENEQAGDWAGHRIAYVLGIDVTNKAEKKRVKRMLGAWIEDGTLQVVEQRDPLRRTSKKFVKSGVHHHP